MADGKAVREKGEAHEERFAPYLPAYLRHVDDEEQGQPATYPGAIGPFILVVNASVYVGFDCGFEGSAQEVPSERKRKGDVMKALKEAKGAAQHLTRAFEKGDPANLQGALLDVIKARGGSPRVASRSGMSEWRLKLMLWDEEESWKLIRLGKLLNGMGLRLAVRPDDKRK